MAEEGSHEQVQKIGVRPEEARHGRKGKAKEAIGHRNQS